MQIGAWYQDRSCQFTLWAPLKQDVALHLVSPDDRLIPMQQDDRGYWHCTVDVEPEALYFYQVNGVDQGDPASYLQPKGVHGPSAVVDHQAFTWTDQHWQGIPLEQMVIYELHIGTFTPEGTFEAVIPRLADLQKLGVNAIEIMPVAQFPGSRNWGYDGVFPYATQESYGGVAGLKQLVNACHQMGIAVVLDVVYNHLGPEGNYLWGLGGYFTEKYHTPWGAAINFDDAYSDGVREYFIGNTLYWLEHLHIDALRLDAVHAIYDFGAKHIMQELAEAKTQLEKQVQRSLYLIAESDLNDPRLIRSIDAGGYGIDSQWCDDFHHAVHTLLTGERHGYYEDYGELHHLAKAYQHAFIYDWNYSKSRKRYHGAPPSDCPGKQFVVCIQNHDQIGNRMLGDRFSHLISFEAQKLAAATMILSPYIPMLFMGEEYGETAPFLYFVSHGDAALVEAVRSGRRAEFAAFHAAGEAPDPQSEETFKRSILNWDLRQSGQHSQLWRFYQQLLKLRREHSALAQLDRDRVEVQAWESEQVLQVRRWQGDQQVMVWLNFQANPVELTVQLPAGTWQKAIDSSDATWGGAGSELPNELTGEAMLKLLGQSVVVYQC